MAALVFRACCWGEETEIPVHLLLGRRSDPVVCCGLELCVCVAVDGWEAPLRADLFGFHVVRLQKQLWVCGPLLSPPCLSAPLHLQQELPVAGRMQHMLCLMWLWGLQPLQWHSQQAAFQLPTQGKAPGMRSLTPLSPSQLPALQSCWDFQPCLLLSLLSMLVLLPVLTD